MEFATLIALLIAIILPIVTTLIYWGIKLCMKNNGIGLFLLFIPLNILGLVLGIGILYNAKNGMYNNYIEKEKKLKEQNNLKIFSNIGTNKQKKYKK